MSSSPGDHRPSGDSLVNLLPLHLQTIYQLRPSNTFHEGQMKLSENLPKLIGKDSDSHANSETGSPLLSPLRSADLLLTRQTTLPSTSTPSDISKTDSIKSLPAPYSDRRSKNKILRTSYRPPQSFIYNWTIPVNMEDIHAFVHSELITEQNIRSIILIQRKIRLLQRSSAILRLLESAHQRALAIPRIIFRLWRIYAFILRMYRRILHRKVFSTWKIEMLFRVKHKQMEYMCNIFLQSKYFACFKERARINTQLNLFVVTFMKRINLRVTNDIFQFFLYLTKYLRTYRKQLKAFIERTESQTDEFRDLQLTSDNPKLVYKELTKGMPIKFYDIAKALIPTRSSYLIRSFVSDIQYRVQVTLYIRLNLLKYTLISPVFVAWLTTIRMLRIRKNFLLLTYDKLLITAFYRWSDLARGRHKLMTKYLGIWKQYIDKIRLQRYKILLANQFRVKSLAQTYLHRWEDYCLSKDIVRLMAASSLAANSGYASFFIRTLYLLVSGTCVYDAVNRRIVKKAYIVESYTDGGQVGYQTIEDDDGFLMLPGDLATKTLESRKAKEEEAELQRKETQLRNLFDAHIGSRQTRTMGSTFLTQHQDAGSDSEGESIKRLVAPPPRKQCGTRGTPVPYFESYHDEFCLKFRIFQVFKRRPMARKSFLRFILLLQAGDRVYKQIVALQIWRRHVLANKERLEKQKEKIKGALARADEQPSQDIFLTNAISNKSDSKDHSNALHLSKPSDSDMMSQKTPDSFVRLLFFKTHSLLFLTLLHKIAHSPSIGSVISAFDFVPELNLRLFKSVISKILSFSTDQLEDACYLTTKSSLGTCLSQAKTMQLFASIAVLHTNFKYTSFPRQKTTESAPGIQVSTWDKRMGNLQSILSCCGIDTMYSLLMNYNKLQAITKMETDLLEKYQSIEMDITAMGQHTGPLETIVPQMLQEDISVCNLFNEKQSMIRTILESTTLSDNTSSLLERLKRERSYVMKDTTDLTSEAAHELLLFDARASNSLLLKRLLDAVSTEVSAGVATKLEATLASGADSPRRGGGNKLRVMQMAKDLDTEAKVLKSALCECFLSVQHIPQSIKQVCESVALSQTTTLLSPADKYCHICSGCLCLHCACAQRCRCMKSTMMRRSLIFTNYPAITYTLYKRIDSALVFLSDIDEGYDAIEEDYASNLSVSSKCFHICGDTYLRRQIDKDCLRLLLMNTTGSSAASYSSFNNAITTEALEMEGETKIHATLDNEPEEPITKVIVAQLQRKGKSRKKQKYKGKATSPGASQKKTLPRASPPGASNIPEPKPVQTLEDFEMGKTADLLINYANRELIEQLDVYKKVEGQTSQIAEAATYPRPVVQVSGGPALKNALLYTEVAFTMQSTASEPLQNVYLSLDAFGEGPSADYNTTIVSIQRAQEKLLSLELSEPVRHPAEALSQPDQQLTSIAPLVSKDQVITEAQMNTHKIYGVAGQLAQSNSDEDKIQLETPTSNLATARDLLGRRYQVAISENSSAYSTNHPSHSDLSAALNAPLSSTNPTLPLLPSVKDVSSKHSLARMGSSPRRSSSTSRLVATPADIPPGLEIEPSRGLSAQTHRAGPPHIIVQDTQSELREENQGEDSSEASLLAFFQDLPPEKESSSRSILVSSQLRSRETVRQISHQIDKELSRIASALPAKSASSRRPSSEATDVSLKNTEPVGPLSVADTLTDIDADLNGLKLSIQRIPSAPYNASHSTSRGITTAKSNSTRRPTSEGSTSQVPSIPVNEEYVESVKDLKHAMQTPIASDVSRGVASVQSDRQVKNRYSSASTAINMPLETVTEANSLSIEAPASVLQQVVGQSSDHASTSDRILDILQNIQSKFVDLETDSAEERVANLFKHLQEPEPGSVDLNIGGQKHAPSNVTLAESTSDDEFKLSLKPTPTIELLQLNMNLERTISRQMQLRNSERVASPRVGNKSVSRLVHQKLLDELGQSFPRVGLDDSVLRMQSGLVGTPIESMNVTEISVNHHYSRLQRIEEKVQDMIGPKAKYWKEQQTMLQYAKDAEDLNLSSDESLLRDEEDSFIIELDSVDSSSLSFSDLVLSASSSSDKIVKQEALDVDDLPSKQALKHDGGGPKSVLRPRLLQKNKKVGKISTRYDKRLTSSIGPHKRASPEFALRELNITCYNRILGEYKQARDASNGERTVSSADAYKLNAAIRRSGRRFQERGSPLPQYRWKRFARVTSSPAMKYSERHSIQKPKRRSPVYVHLATATKEARVYLPTLTLHTDTGLAALGNGMWNAPTKSPQASLLAKRTIDKHRRISHDAILSPIFLSSESSSTVGKAHIKPEYVSAWRKTRKLKYIGSADLVHNNKQLMDTEPDPSAIPAPEPIRSSLESMKDYIISKLDANIFITGQQAEEEPEQTQSTQGISCPSTVLGDLPSSPKSSEDSTHEHMSHVQKRNQELIRILEECLLMDPVTNRYSNMIDLMSINTSSLFDLTTEQTSQDEKPTDYTLIREFAKAAPRTALQKYTDLEADTQLKKQIEQTKVELTTLSAGANSYCSPTTISMQNSTATPTVVKKQLEDDDPEFTLTPLSIWGAEHARHDHTYVASYPETKMTDEEFHNTVLSQTFEVLSKAIQLAHGNKMITAQRCRESIEAKKMSVWEIASGSRRSQSIRDLCNRNAQLMFSRSIHNALHRKLYNADATPIVRGFGLREGSPTPDLLHGGPDLLSSLLRWRRKREGYSGVQKGHIKAGLYAIQSHKLTKGEATTFQNSLWMSPGRKTIPLDVSSFRLVGSPTRPTGALKNGSHLDGSLINIPHKSALHHVSPYAMKRGHTMSIGVLARACAIEGTSAFMPRITAMGTASHLAIANVKPLSSEQLTRMRVGCTYFVSDEQREGERTEHPQKRYTLSQILRIHSKPMVVSDQRITNMKANIYVIDMNGRPLRKSPDLPPKPHGNKYGESPKSPRHEMGIRLPASEASKKNVPRPVAQPLRPGSQRTQLLTVQGILPNSPVVKSPERSRENSAGYLKHKQKSRHIPGALGQIPTSSMDSSISLTDDENS